MLNSSNSSVHDELIQQCIGQGEDIIEDVLDGAKRKIIRRPDESGRNLMHRAAELNAGGLIKVLLGDADYQYMANQANGMDHGRLPIHYAAASLAGDAVLSLLTDENAVAVDSLGNTPLHLLASSNVSRKDENIEGLFVLLEGDATEMKNQDGKTPTELAAENLNPAFAKAFDTQQTLEVRNIRNDLAKAEAKEVRGKLGALKDGAQAKVDRVKKKANLKIIEVKNKIIRPAKRKLSAAADTAKKGAKELGKKVVMAAKQMQEKAPTAAQIKATVKPKLKAASKSIKGKASDVHEYATKFRLDPKQAIKDMVPRKIHSAATKLRTDPKRAIKEAGDKVSAKLYSASIRAKVFASKAKDKVVSALDKADKKITPTVTKYAKAIKTNPKATIKGIASKAKNKVASALEKADKKLTKAERHVKQSISKKDSGPSR